MVNKIFVRERGKAARLRLEPAVRAQYDERIVKRCQTGFDWKHYGRVMVFRPIADRAEIDLWPLIQWGWSTLPGVRLYAPRVNGGYLEAVQIVPGSVMQNSEWGVPEPADGPILEAGAKLDLVLTPLLGFDESGHRVGYGRGYYDRFFAEHPHTRRVGLGYECLFVPEGIEASPHDVAMHGVITEARYYEVSGGFAEAKAAGHPS